MLRYGSQRAMKSIEDFTAFEQRAAYFHGDPVMIRWNIGPAPDRSSGLKECEQVRVDLVLMGRAQAVRSARIDFQRGALDDLR